MPRSPLPNIPRLARPPRRKSEYILLACPRISPEWEFAALKALIKPQTKDAILHRAGEQVMTEQAADQIRLIVREFGDLTDFRPDIHWPPDGDYHFAATIPAASTDMARALAIAVSRAAPDLWLTISRLLIQQGRFFRRRRGVKLELRQATDIRLPREFHAVLAQIPAPPS